ncbi:hypothetical protein DFQ01_10725 [Paenibacillus cellulosilyticus]|uniref:Uncharacterized protein n=1 Tax=Paenibacillus cellulosilyticus TaxID=375489 RepID=A0A2V2YTX6_9BACL|nr:hypothetical protein DFQ01_10725 [Paenibacillus cellulosilyticus]
MYNSKLCPRGTRFLRHMFASAPLSIHTFLLPGSRGWETPGVLPSREDLGG